MRFPLWTTAVSLLLGFTMYCHTEVRGYNCILDTSFLRDGDVLFAKLVVDFDYERV